MFGLFGCSGPRAVVYKPDVKAQTHSCAVVQVTEVKMGRPVSPSVVRPDSWFDATVMDAKGLDDASIRVDFESLTRLKPAVGDTLQVHLNEAGDVVRIDPASAGTRCDEPSTP